MGAKIQVDIAELMEKLNEMLEDEYATVELKITESEYFSDSFVELKAIDISEEENCSYGELRCVADVFEG